MFSALRKLTKKGEDKVTFPTGVAVMTESMQKRFSRGIQYNMKIILKGDRNTGKSCLLTRLQGKAFREEYIPTHEIQVACINWNYRGADDVVKVEVWDVVDKGDRKRKKSGSLKVSHDDTEPNGSDSDGMALDAEFVDVFKGTHGVIMLLDITKTWTWTYVERELPKIPYHIPVLLMANFRDMGDHRLVDEDRMLAYIQHLERPPGSAEIYYTESSLKNGFGLRYIYRFLNMPFLILQRETFLRQLEANALEIEDTREQLQHDPESEDQNYDRFLEMLEARKQNKARSPKADEDHTAVVTVNGHDNSNQLQFPPSSSPSSLASTPAESKVSSPSLKEEKKPSLGKGSFSAVKSGQSNSKVAIDSWMPYEELDPSFLGESAANLSRKHHESANAESSSDDESGDGNPLVEAYHDLDVAETPSSLNTLTDHQHETSQPKNHVLKDTATDTPEGISPEPLRSSHDTHEKEESSDEDTSAYIVAADIDIDSDGSEGDHIPTSKPVSSITKQEIPPQIETTDCSLAGLDDFLAEQLRKTSVSEIEPNQADITGDKGEEEEVKEHRKKKKKSKKEKHSEDDNEKPRKKKTKTKSKDGEKRKKRTENPVAQNTDYELI